MKQITKDENQVILFVPSFFCLQFLPFCALPAYGICLYAKHLHFESEEPKPISQYAISFYRCMCKHIKTFKWDAIRSILKHWQSNMFRSPRILFHVGFLPSPFVCLNERWTWKLPEMITIYIWNFHIEWKHKYVEIEM